MMVTHVKFTYFKDSGKYYSEGEHDFKGPIPFHEVIQECERMFDNGLQPGLVSGAKFNCLIMVYTEFGPLPWLYLHK